MRHELEFSVMEPMVAVLQPLLDQFAAEQRITVRLRPYTWDNGWRELTKVARTGEGPDVSEIGSTWLGELIATHALRPFAAADMGAVGGAGAFLPAAWPGGRPGGQADIWAIPWMVGARLLYFRRNLLTAAGVPMPPVFPTADHLDRTLRQLQTGGVAVPWIVPTGTTHTTLLNAASWVWGAGGDFVTPDGKQILFNQPPARAGLRAYFSLNRYLPASVRHLRGDQPDAQFLHNAATAMTISGHWLFVGAQNPAGATVSDVGAALPPGPSFVGGSYLVVWKHSQRAAAALELVRFLSRRAAQLAYPPAMGLLPATQEALSAPAFATDPAWQVVQQALRGGRTFPATSTWGVIEYRLVATFSTLWAEIMADAHLDLDATLARHLDSLAERLEPLLTS